VPWGSVALTAYVPHNYPLETLEPGLNENAFYDPTNFTYPAGSYVCEVEVDPETGKVKIESFVAGRRLRQRRQPDDRRGPGARRHRPGPGPGDDGRGCLRRQSGQLLTGSYMDYAMPRAIDIPSFRVGTTCTPCSHNPLGVKGCGEAGAIGSPAAYINAVTDALGIVDLAMPPRRSASGARRTACRLRGQDHVRIRIPAAGEPRRGQGPPPAPMRAISLAARA
jgi:carbon-monoxide dehydrogenase large subunit